MENDKDILCAYAVQVMRKTRRRSMLVSTFAYFISSAFMFTDKPAARYTALGLGWVVLLLGIVWAHRFEMPSKEKPTLERQMQSLWENESHASTVRSPFSMIPPGSPRSYSKQISLQRNFLRAASTDNLSEDVPWQVTNDVTFAVVNLSWGLFSLLDYTTMPIVNVILGHVSTFYTNLRTRLEELAEDYSGTLSEASPFSLKICWTGATSVTHCCHFSLRFMSEMRTLLAAWLEEVRSEHKNFVVADPDDPRRELYTRMLGELASSDVAPSILHHLLDESSNFTPCTIGIACGSLLGGKPGMVSKAAVRASIIAKMAEVSATSILIERSAMVRASGILTRNMYPVVMAPNMLEAGYGPAVQLYEVLPANQGHYVSDTYKHAIQCLRDDNFITADDLLTKHRELLATDHITPFLQEIAKSGIEGDRLEYLGYDMAIQVHSTCIEKLEMGIARNRLDSSQRRRSTMMAVNDRGLVDIIVAAADAAMSPRSTTRMQKKQATQLINVLGRKPSLHIFKTEDQKSAERKTRYLEVMRCCGSVLFMFVAFMQFAFILVVAAFNLELSFGMAVIDTVSLSVYWGNIMILSLDAYKTRKEATVYPYTYKNEWIDILGSLPCELVGLLAGSSFRDAMFRLNRVANMARFPYHYDCLSDKLHPGLIPIYVQATKFVIKLFCLCHAVACVWWYLSDNPTHITDPALKYTTALEWSVTTLSGYGSKPWPKTDAMHVLYVVVSLVGVAVFAVVLAITQEMMSVLDPNKRVYEDTLDNVLTWLDHKKAPRHIKADFIAYYRYLWTLTKSISTSQFDFLIADEPGFPPLPPILADRLQLHLNARILEQVPLFASLMHNTEFVSEVVSALKLEAGVPGSSIIEEGDKADAMYFIAQGEVGIYLNYSDYFTTLGPGDLFGEMGLIFGKNRFCTVRCITHVQLFRLAKMSFVTIARRFPSCFQEILDIAEERREDLECFEVQLKVRKASCDIFNDFSRESVVSRERTCRSVSEESCFKVDDKLDVMYGKDEDDEGLARERRQCVNWNPLALELS